MKIENNQLRLGSKLNILDRILISIASILIVIVLLIFNIYTKSVQKNQLELIGIVMDKMSINQKTQFESFIDDKIKIMQTLVTYPEVYNMVEWEQKKFLGTKASAFGFRHMFIVNTEGRGYYFSEEIHRDHSREDFFIHIMQNDVYLTEPFYSDYAPTVMTVCVSVYNTMDEKVGVLCGAISLESIQDLITENEVILNGKCFIIDKAGNYMTSENSKDVDGKVSIYEHPNSDVRLVAEAFTYEKDMGGTIVYKGEEYLAHVTYLPDYKWGIVQMIPMSEITQRFEFMSSVQWILIFLVASLLLCVVRIVYCWNKSDKKIYTDVLTQCNSRAACLSILESLEEQRKVSVSVVYMDLNRFKYVNDNFGHDKGDELLRIFADILNSVFGKIGFVGRMGGDEFIAILANVSDKQIDELCNEVEKNLWEKSKTLDFPYVISSSYGYATRKKGQKESLDLILQEADERMYAYKAAQKKNK